MALGNTGPGAALYLLPKMKPNAPMLSKEHSFRGIFLSFPIFMLVIWQKCLPSVAVRWKAQILENLHCARHYETV